MLANITQFILWLIAVAAINFGAYKIAIVLFAHGSSSAFDWGVFACLVAFMLDLIAIYFLFDKKQWE